MSDQNVDNVNVAISHLESALAAAQVEISALKAERVEQQIELNDLSADILIRDTLGSTLYKYLDADIKSLLREATLPNYPVGSDGKLDEGALVKLIEEKASRFLKKGDGGMSVAASKQSSKLPPSQRLPRV